MTKAEFVRAIPKLGPTSLLPRYAPRGQRWKASQQKDWHGSGSWRSAHVRRPQGAQLQEEVDAATVAVVAAAAACIPSRASEGYIDADGRGDHVRNAANFKKNLEL